MEELWERWFWLSGLLFYAAFIAALLVLSFFIPAPWWLHALCCVVLLVPLSWVAYPIAVESRDCWNIIAARFGK